MDERAKSTTFVDVKDSPKCSKNIMVERVYESKHILSYRFPRVFGDEFGEKFSDSLNLVKNVVTILVMNLVNHHILCQIQ